MDTAQKTRENLLRRMAGRQGLVLTRSRRRDPRAADYGLYWLTGTRRSDGVIFLAGPGTPSLDEIEQLLLSAPCRR